MKPIRHVVMTGALLSLALAPVSVAQDMSQSPQYDQDKSKDNQPTMNPQQENGQQNLQQQTTVEESTTTVTTTSSQLPANESFTRASAVLGVELKNRQDEQLGEIQEVVVNGSTGEVVYAVVSRGGVLGMGNELYAVPWNAFERDPQNPESLLLDISAERLEQAPKVDMNQLPKAGDREWIENMDQFYGVERDARLRRDGGIDTYYGIDERGDRVAGITEEEDDWDFEDWNDDIDSAEVADDETPVALDDDRVARDRYERDQFARQDRDTLGETPDKPVEVTEGAAAIEQDADEWDFEDWNDDLEVAEGDDDDRIARDRYDRDQFARQDRDEMIDTREGDPFARDDQDFDDRDRYDSGEWTRFDTADQQQPRQDVTTTIQSDEQRQADVTLDGEERVDVYQERHELEAHQWHDGESQPMVERQAMDDDFDRADTDPNVWYYDERTAQERRISETETRVERRGDDGDQFGIQSRNEAQFDDDYDWLWGDWNASLRISDKHAERRAAERRAEERAELDDDSRRWARTTTERRRTTTTTMTDRDDRDATQDFEPDQQQPSRYVFQDEPDDATVQEPQDRNVYFQDEPQRDRDVTFSRSVNLPATSTRVSEIIGSDVLGEPGNEIGEVDDLIIAFDQGRVTHVVVSSGGVLGIDEQLHAVPFQLVNVDEREGELVAMLQIDESELSEAAAFTRGEWPNLADANWVRQNDAAFGIDQSMGRTTYYGIEDQDAIERRQPSDQFDANVQPMSTGWQSGSEYNKLYEQGDEETLTGEVVEVELTQIKPGMEECATLVITTDDNERLTSHLGPAWFITRQPERIPIGTNVEVAGSKVEVNGQPVMLVREVTFGPENDRTTWKLREDNGDPVWTATTDESGAASPSMNRDTFDPENQPTGFDEPQQDFEQEQRQDGEEPTGG